MGEGVRMMSGRLNDVRCFSRFFDIFPTLYIPLIYSRFPLSPLPPSTLMSTLEELTFLSIPSSLHLVHVFLLTSNRAQSSRPYG